MGHIKNFKQYLLESSKSGANNVAYSKFWNTPENNLFWIFDSWFPKISFSDQVFLTLYAHNYNCPFIEIIGTNLPEDFEEDDDGLQSVEIDDYAFALYHNSKTKTLRDDLGLPVTPEWKSMSHEIDVCLQGEIEPYGTWYKGYKGSYYDEPEPAHWEIDGTDAYLTSILVDEGTKEMKVKTVKTYKERKYIFSVEVLSTDFEISKDSGYDAQTIAQLGHWALSESSKGEIPQQLIDKIIKVLTEEDYKVLVYGIIEKKVNEKVLKLLPEEYSNKEFISSVKTQTSGIRTLKNLGL